MTDPFDKHLNDILVDTFHVILKVEEQAIKNCGVSNLSINEMHLLEAVDKDADGRRTISDIAQELNITLPSVTVAINKLVHKGYVKKARGENDARMVYVILTEKGNKMLTTHNYFHQQMVRSISTGLTAEEKHVLSQAIKKLNLFFRQQTDNWRQNEF